LSNNLVGKISAHFKNTPLYIIFYKMYTNADIQGLQGCILKKIYFDSLALKRLGLYVNLLGPFVAYSQPFNLVYK
jgi:hypothetical protein